MAEEVLRLRATVVSDEALKDIRRIGREIGLVQHMGGKGAAQAATGWAALGKQIKGVGQELLGAVPALGGFGLGAAGAGVAAYKLVNTLGDISKGILDLKTRSKELGISTTALKAFATEAQRAGVAPEAMAEGLKNFKRNTDDFALRIGQLRGQMVAMGAGPVLAAINNAATTLDKLKVAYDFKEVLNKEDPSGVKAQRFFEMLGLGADTARLKWDDLVKTMHEQEPITDDQVKKAQAYQDALIKLGSSWDDLKTTVATALFPSISEDLKNLGELIEVLNRISNWKLPSWLPNIPGPGALGPWIEQNTMGFDPFGLKAKHAKERSEKALGAAGDIPTDALLPPRAAPAPSGPILLTPEALRKSMLHGSSSSGDFHGMIHKASFGGDTGGESGATRIIRLGVFQGMVDFKSYMETGSGGDGGGGGFQRASFGAGGGGGGGGFGLGGGGGLAGGGSFGGLGGPTDGQAAAKPGPGGQGVSSGGFMDALAGIESNNRNIVSGTDRDASGRTLKQGGNADQISQGYFQINQATWKDFAPKAGVDISKYSHAMMAPRDVQAKVAAMIPFARFGGRTKSMMRAQFGDLSTKATIGDLAAAHGGAGPNGQAAAPAGSGAAGSAGAMNAPGGAPPAAFVLHHTAGRGTPEGVVNWWRKQGKGIGAEYIMDRQGVVHDVRKEYGYTGTGQILPSYGKVKGLTNRNTLGMEIIAKDDSDLSPEEKAAVAPWMAKNFPNTPVYGHGQLNPGHREASEGMTAVRAIEADRAARTARLNGAVSPTGASGSVNVTVNSNGTKAEAKAETAGKLFQPPTIKQHRQMQRTEDAAGVDI